ncbi:MAG: XRE family transcriptional regulator [Candidatus Electrothrix sp. EH2]|nr:XRE family transcriptional regulator [Candidatus Electrothrix sp. EH2]
MAGRVENINKNILRQCRRQIGLPISEVKKKVAKIAEIEQGEHKPTFKQLDTLAQLYNVPRWVFISDHLPEEYQFAQKIPAFRQFAKNNTDVFSDSKVRALTAKVEGFRRLILELHEDMGEPVPTFNPPQISNSTAPDRAAQLVRDWLSPSEEHNDFGGLSRVLVK